MNIYGIDLGTTNSLIGLHKTGFLSEIVPSCADLENKTAGAKLYDNMKAARSFKTDMSMGVEGTMPIAASSLVLRELCNQVTEEKVTDVVISVPADFNDSQRAATIKAAEQAGLTVRGLVNEPTAAAMMISHKTNRKGLFVVYDLGGGTFDVSIIDNRFGAYDVQATDGDMVGGDDLDENIMKFFIKNGNVPFHKMCKEDRLCLQHYSKHQKETMQKLRTSYSVDLSPFGGTLVEFTPEIYIQLLKITFGRTINMVKKMCVKWIPPEEVWEIYLVGGSTHCPFLQEWIEEELGKRPVSLDYDPDRVVAQGAALYADLVEKGLLESKVSDVTKALSIGLNDGTVSTIVEANSKIPLVVEKMFTNSTTSDKLIIDLYQGNSSFASDNDKIGTLVWDYDSVVEAYSSSVIVEITVDTNGIIQLSAGELLKQKKTIVIERS